MKSKSIHTSNSSIENHSAHASDILSHISYAALKPSDQLVVQSVFDAFQSSNADHHTLASAFKGLSVDVFRKKHELSESVEIFSNRLDSINPTTIHLLNHAQKKALHQELLFGFYIFSTQFYLHEVESNKQYLKNIAEKLHQTTNLIHVINCDKLEGPKAILARELGENDKLCKYLAIPLGQEIANRTTKFIDSQTDAIKGMMDPLNERRLFWVWGEDVVAWLLRLLPDSFANKKSAEKALHAPDGILGAVGWSLYYARFTIELGLLLKHTLQGPWMNEDEALIPAYERFQSQWQQRKFIMLNDLAWATVNLVTYFWLVGKGLMGYLGDVVTVSLLLFDASVTLWRYFEEDTLHNQTMLRIEKDIQAIEDKLIKANDEEQGVLKHQLKTLKAKQRKSEFDWRYKKYQLALDVTYAVALICTYAMACCFLLPAGILNPATSFALGMAGSTLCLAITIAYTVISGVIDIQKTQNTVKELQQDGLDLLEQFNREKSPDMQKLIYLDLVHSVHQNEFHSQMVAHQKRELVRKVLIDTMIPGMVFLTLVFLPIGAGIGALATGLALMAMSKYMLDQYKPQQQALPDFDEKAYQAFKDEPSLELIKDVVDEAPKKPGFFDSKQTSENKDTDHQGSEWDIAQDTPGSGNT